MNNKFVFTCGDTNGIGPEIVLKTLIKIADKNDDKYFLIIPRNIFNAAVEKIKPEFSFEFISDPSAASSKLNILPLDNAPIKKGMPTPESGMASFLSIKKSFELLKEGFADTVITAPISKTAINMAEINFPGHTEMFAQWCGIHNYVMTFLSKKMNAALVTIHEPIKKVSGLVTKEKLRETFDTVIKMLKTDLRIINPRIALLGLNPHAGEEGLIGTEEMSIVKPLLNEIEYKNISGPFSSDAFFANKLFKNYDIVVGMYHDQILIPFKLINFSSGVNYTAGLPIVRTSPDHGVAYDIAGQNKADPSSMIESVMYAKKIVKNRKKNVEKK
jgi:4-hydroxythreonine-4-phosphate dehydrogenase